MSEKRKTIITKSKRGVATLVFSRLGIILLLFIFHLAVLFYIFYAFENFLPQVFGGSLILTALVVLYILNCDMSPNAKVTWLLLIMILPVFGSLLFWYTRSDLGHRALKERAEHVYEMNKGLIPQNRSVLRDLEKENDGISNLAKYVSGGGRYPVFKNSEATYFPLGEDKLSALLTELQKAEKFIFLEYFIIAEGEMWNSVLAVLERKAREGVEVRIMYDGTAEFTTLPRSFAKKMKKLGIKCKAFSPLTPFISTHYNYRDHRKIVVIDGQVAFCGGINLSDEYINKGSRFGHWKDTAVMVKGSATNTFVLMFLEMWSLDTRRENYEKYLIATPEKSGEGYVIPFGDCPTDKDKTGERVYMDILNRSTKFVHIMTPYLILDSEMETALRFSAERGVDVSIILPGIPDKKSAFALAKTHYKALLSSGVKIYEYTPGFVHAKTLVADSREAVVGTINLDYRSFYHHFECATYFAHAPVVFDVERDFQDTLKKSKEVTLKTIKRENIFLKLLGFILKAIAPLM